MEWTRPGWTFTDDSCIKKRDAHDISSILGFRYGHYHVTQTGPYWGRLARNGWCSVPAVWCLYEQRHKYFKEGYKLASKHVSSAMDEWTVRQGDRFFLKSSSSCAYKRMIRREKLSRDRAVREDGGYLVKNGPKVTIHELGTAWRFMFETTRHGLSF